MYQVFCYIPPDARFFLENTKNNDNLSKLYEKYFKFFISIVVKFNKQNDYNVVSHFTLLDDSSLNCLFLLAKVSEDSKTLLQLLKNMTSFLKNNC